jgi:tetratricopeptide (TPR) repeat protein
MLWLAAAADAQVDEFERSYAEAERLRAAASATAAELRNAYAHALGAFLRIPPEQYGGWLAAGAFTALQAGHPDYAAEWFDQLAAAAPTDDAVFGWHFAALLGAGRADAALRLARARGDGSADPVRGALLASGRRVLQVADELLRLGDGELALWAFRAMAAAAPEDAAALGNVALALRHLGREAEAEAMYRTALAMAPADALLWNDFGLFLKGTGRRDEAIAALLRSVAAEPDPALGPAIGNLAQLGVGIRHEGRAHTAVEALALVLAARPDAAGKLSRRVQLDLLLKRGGPGTDNPGAGR